MRAASWAVNRAALPLPALCHRLALHPRLLTRRLSSVQARRRPELAFVAALGSVGLEDGRSGWFDLQVRCHQRHALPQTFWVRVARRVSPAGSTQSGERSPHSRCRSGESARSAPLGTTLARPTSLSEFPFFPAGCCGLGEAEPGLSALWEREGPSTPKDKSFRNHPNTHKHTVAPLRPLSRSNTLVVLRF